MTSASESNLSAPTEAGGTRRGTFLLPRRAVNTAIGQARKKAAELLAERAAAVEDDAGTKKDEKPAKDPGEDF